MTYSLVKGDDGLIAWERGVFCINKEFLKISDF